MRRTVSYALKWAVVITALGGVLLGFFTARSDGYSTVVTTLTKGIDVVDQTLVPRQDRYKNVNNSFVINQKVYVKDKKILILDDIITSGATLNTCAQELIKYGAYSVTALTFSRAVARKEKNETII